ncbi:hypothetical protein CTI12_AA380840 [Artemisia annua]|uniref:Uncharacterized protein n=1 Tax=Artemisia annua TaxID=35608 RepID=A0A2U1MFH7_ARTAN|nr:hypothetical protein CTI12_AA380840 [Artemisia annua]
MSVVVCSMVLLTWAWTRNLRSGQLETLMVLLQHHCPSPIDDHWDFTLHHSNMYFVSVMRKYIDSISLLTGGDLCEPNVVTELPKPLFKKPKLRDNNSAVGLDCEDGAKLRRPVFGKRNIKKKVDYPVKLYSLKRQEIRVSSKWGEYNKIQHKDNVDHSFAYKATSSIMSKFKRPVCDNVDHGFTNIGSSSVTTKLKRPASKWNYFLDDDNDLELEMIRFEETNNAAFERKVSDEIVEDDVHPDFL